MRPPWNGEDIVSIIVGQPLPPDSSPGTCTTSLWLMTLGRFYLGHCPSRDPDAINVLMDAYGHPATTCAVMRPCSCRFLPLRSSLFAKVKSTELVIGTVRLTRILVSGRA